MMGWNIFKNVVYRGVAFVLYPALVLICVALLLVGWAAVLVFDLKLGEEKISWMEVE